MKKFPSQGGFNFSIVDGEIKIDSATNESESEGDETSELDKEDNGQRLKADYEDQVVIKSVVELKEHIKQVSSHIFQQTYTFWEIFRKK